VEVEERDVIREPPPRAFLEKHVDATRLADFLSTRSPIFKQRGLPASKREAIDLMLSSPNLIKRPILVAGQRAIFGFQKEAFRELAAQR
jgi:arsenate reductase-like glutaredoxin family protein